MESLISLQSEGLRSIGEPTTPRPSGVQQVSVLVVVDVNKGVGTEALYWTLGNVVRKGDHLKILGIITHIPNPMGFMVRVDQSTRSSPNIMELQFEIVTKKEAIWRTAFLKEWCEKAGVKLEVDVKAGNNPKVIASDEAKAMGACHVILDKTMKKDRKYFIDNLSCFVSRIRSNGGVDTLRSFAMSNKLPPMAPTTPKKTANTTSHHNHNRNESGHQSKASMASTSSYRGSSMSSTSFELAGENCDDFSAQEADPVTIQGTIEGTIPGTIQGDSPSNSAETPLAPQPTVRINPNLLPNQLFNLLHTADANNRGPNLNNTSASTSNSNSIIKTNSNSNGNSNSKTYSNSSSSGLNWNNSLSVKPNSNGLNWNCNFSSKGLNWNPEPSAPLTPKAEFRFEQGPLQSGSFASFQSGWIGQLNVAPEFGTKTHLGRTSLTTSLQTQASFNSSRRKHSLLRAEKITMDLHWPLMHWADCRAFKLRTQHHGSSSLISSSSNSSLSNFRGRRRVAVSGLNYSDMVDSD